MAQRTSRSSPNRVRANQISGYSPNSCEEIAQICCMGTECVILDTHSCHHWLCCMGTECVILDTHSCHHWLCCMGT